MSENEKLPIETDVQTVAEMKRSGADFVLLDVREQDEYDFAKIDGSVLIPMSEIQDRIGELEPHKNLHLIVHCHHGGRSMNVMKFLVTNGYTRVQNLAGGIDAWSKEIDDSVPRY